MRCFYFGCWNVAGHNLWAPGGQSAFRVVGTESRNIERFSGDRHLDGSLAPLSLRRTGALCWGSQFPLGEYVRADECPQGQFLRHKLDNGFTVIAWWDRNQGDSRGACNSTVLLEGEHTSEEMLAALAEHFPHVLANLKRAGVELVDVTPEVTK